MRDRLIELLENATGTQYYGDEIVKTEIDIDEDDIKRIADHLIENGVIAPPCKVGNKIYRKVGDGSIIAWDIVRMDIYVDEMGFVDDSDNWIGFDDIDKTVFLTKEEAEQALKGGEG